MDTNHMNNGNSFADNVTKHHLMIGIAVAYDQMDPFLQFLGTIPSDSGLVYVITTFKKPLFSPLSIDILSSYTTMPVHYLIDTVLLEKNHIYLVPTDRDYVLEDGQITILTDPLSQHHSSIDQLFCALVNYSERLVIGIVFAGENADKTIGTETLIQANGFIIHSTNKNLATQIDNKQIILDTQNEYYINPLDISELLLQLIKYDSIVIKTLLHKVRKEGKQLSYPNFRIEHGTQNIDKLITITIKPFNILLRMIN